MIHDPDPFADTERLWRELPPPDATEIESAERMRRIHRHFAGERVVAIGLPVALLGLIAVALWHASNHLERALGTSAALGVVIVGAVYVATRLRERRALAATAPDFVAVVLRRRRAERRLAAFIAIVLILELLFLIPWWSGGVSKHADHLLSTVVVLTLWLPAVAIALLGLWALRLWRTARAQIHALAEIAAEFDKER